MFIRELTNDDDGDGDGDGEGDTVENVGYKMNLYFTYESRDTLKSYSLFLVVNHMAHGINKK